MIFISYSREDRASANLVARKLRARGLNVARDPVLVQGDPFWRRTVRRTLAQSRFMVVLWSRHAARSPWVEQEVRDFEGRRHFLPLDQTPQPEARGTENGTDTRREESAVTPLAAQERNVAGVLRDLRQSRSLRPARSSHPDASPERSGGNLPDDDGAEDVSRLRREHFAAEEARLGRFLRDLGGRRAVNARPDGRTLQLDDGTRLILLEGTGRNGESRDEVYLAATPVRNDQYRRFVEATGYPPPPTWRREEFRIPEAPVVGVTWFEAKAYAAWVGGDLPTQAEWEWAATGGDTSVEYATASGALAGGAAYFGVRLDEGAPAPNLAYPANRLGFYGMCGNTWDWCSDGDGPHRIIRGGGYMDAARFCKTRAAYRNAPIDRDCSVGFRIRAVARATPGGETE